MNEIKVHDRYNYIGAFLTLRCGLSCSYCINDDNGVSRKRHELSADEWVFGLNRLDIRPDLPITLEGGEPTKHKDFYDIIEEVNHPIDLLTNLQFDIPDFCRRVDPKWLSEGSHKGYKSIRATFHPEEMDIDETIGKAALLQNAGYSVGLFSLNLPESIEANMEMAEMARDYKLYFFIKDFLGKRDGRLFGHYKYLEAIDGNKKGAMCRSKELLIAPNGLIYRCHRDLYKCGKHTTSLLSQQLEIDDIFKHCDNYGTCNPCDVKLKTNRFLQMGSCSVEIKDEE